jgi:prepilin-type N-terminal cleavage/methylation domain-containing protein
MGRRLGLTLLELLVVLFILVVLAAMVVPLLSRSPEETQKQVTETNLTQLRDTIMNVYRPDMNKLLPRPGSLGLSQGRKDHPQLRYLFVNPKTETTQQDFDPVTRLGWRGPYLLNTPGKYAVIGTFTKDYGEDGDPAILDGWARPIVVQEGVVNGQPSAWLLSAGPDGILGNSDDLKLTLY